MIYYKCVLHYSDSKMRFPKRRYKDHTAAINSAHAMIAKNHKIKRICIYKYGQSALYYTINNAFAEQKVPVL